MSLVEHAIRELELSGQAAESPEYAQSIVAAVAAFASYGHSDGSASVAIEQLHRLLQFKTLSPVTSDPDEWVDRSEMSNTPLWQNKRDSSCFSTDGGQTWYSLDDPKPQYVVVVNGELATADGRLIVATGEEEKAALVGVGAVVPLPHARISVTEWVDGAEVLEKMVRSADV